MKKSCKVIKILFALFSAVLFSACAAPEVRYIEKKCEVTMPLRPHSADFVREFDYLEAIFLYVFELEKTAKICIN